MLDQCAVLLQFESGPDGLGTPEQQTDALDEFST
jgi:hypothetical protein